MATSRYLHCGKVHASWHRPVRTVWLNFSDEHSARAVHHKFESGTYRIAKRLVKAAPPAGSGRPPSRGRGYQVNYGKAVWTVMLTAVPEEATRDQIQKAITTTSEVPKHIETGRSGSQYSRDEQFAMLETLFSERGPCKSWINETSPVNSGRFKVTTAICDVLEDEITKQSNAWQTQHVQLRAYRNSDTLKRFTVLKVEGEQAKAVAGATNALEKILAGKALAEEGVPLWHTAFTGNGHAFQQVKQIQQQQNVIVLRNKLRRQLTYFGPQDKYEAIMQLLINLINNQLKTTQIIPLDADQFSWACHGGYKQILERVGDNVAILDVVSSPKRLVITGSLTQYEAALSMVRERQVARMGPDATVQDRTCSICWTEAENPVTTSCKHLYCLECFENLCMSSQSAGRGLRVSCQGAMGKCKMVLKLQEVQNLLSSSTFEDLLEASFAAYVRQLRVLRSCPTPDCDSIYRTTAKAGNWTCLKCFEVICTACHEPHGFMTCATYQDLKSGGYDAFERYKATAGVKDCPRCKTPMVKTEGCNHMTCPCGAHICWVCLKYFETKGPCYDHLSEAHGGCFADAVA